MTATDLASLGQLVTALGVPGLLAAAIIAFWRGWVVTAAHHKDVVTDKDEQIKTWRDIAEKERTRGDAATSQLAATTQSFSSLRDLLADMRDTIREISRARTHER